jgi:hypothetical protein
VAGTDFGEILRGAAKKAGTTKLGTSFVTSASETPPAWEACAPYQGSVVAISGLQAKVLPATPAAFLICAGDDSNACSASFATKVKATLPTFSESIRVLPLLDYTGGSIDSIKANLAALVAATFPLPTDRPAEPSPLPTSELDKQLLGASNAPRPLLTSSSPPAGPAHGGKLPLSGVLIYAPITPAQRAALFGQ